MTRSPHTHDASTGKPLPEFIRNGSVAYVPMRPSEKWAERRRLRVLAPDTPPPSANTFTLEFEPHQP